MTTAMMRYQRAGIQLRIARAQLLLQITSNGRNADRLPDLLAIARMLAKGLAEGPAADSVPAFRAAMTAELQLAQTELDRLQNGNSKVSLAPGQCAGGDPDATFSGAKHEW